MSNSSLQAYEQALLADFESMLAEEPSASEQAAIAAQIFVANVDTPDLQLERMVSEQAPAGLPREQAAAPAPAPAPAQTLNGQPWSDYKQLLLDTYVYSHYEGLSMEEDLTGLLYVEYALKQAEIEHDEWLERPAREDQDAPDYERALYALDRENMFQLAALQLKEDLREMRADKRLLAVIYSAYFRNYGLMKVLASFRPELSTAKGFYEATFDEITGIISSRFQSVKYGWLSAEAYYQYEAKTAALTIIARLAQRLKKELVPFKTKKAIEKHAAQLSGAARAAYITCNNELRALSSAGAIIPKTWYQL